MPATGQYIARRFRRGVAPQLATYVTTVQSELLPLFANISARADQIAKDEFERLQASPAGEVDEGDIGSLAEMAQEKGEMFFNALDMLHKTSLTLYTIGLFHLLEQQLAAVCHDAIFDSPPNDARLDKTAAWLKTNLKVDIKTLSSWGVINELRLLANAAKHGEGSALRQLRVIRPALFEDPRLRELLPEHPDIYRSGKVRTPLAGQGIHVSERDFAEYGNVTVEFSLEIARYFESKPNDHFVTGH